MKHLLITVTKMDNKYLFIFAIALITHLFFICHARVVRQTSGTFGEIDEFAAITEEHPERSANNCSSVICSWKVWAHYVEMGCEAIHENQSCCPVKFKCPPFVAGDEQGCRRQGKVLAVGESVPHNNPCQKCKCTDSQFPPAIECMHIECPEHFSQPDTGCKLLYKEEECCSVETKCSSSDDLEPKKPGFTCVHNNKTFEEGEKISPEEEQCTICICQLGFDGINGPGCKKVDNCFTENQNTLQRGCVPVYHVDACCPIDWKCPRRRSSEPLVLEDGVCSFDGKTFPVGAKLELQETCTSCDCITPPQFTCIQTRCL